MSTYKIGFIGDLHLSDRVTGRHKDYYANCMEILNYITDLITKEKLTHLFLTGDVFGTHEHTLKTMEARSAIFEQIAKWNTMLNGELYSIRGNHDSAAKTTDYDLLVATHLLKTTPDNGYGYVDIGGYRVHMLDYGNDLAPISLDESKCNLAVMHSYLRIPGKVDLANIHNAVNLDSLVNLKGVDLVIGGHYHTPSAGYLQTQIEGRDVSLMYIGCPTRPSAADTWTETYMLVATSVEDELGNVTLSEQTAKFKLCPLENLLKPVKEKSEDVQESISRTEMVASVLSELESYNIMGTGAYRTRLENMRSTNPEAVDLCLKYIDSVLAKSK